jgi:hypothetical protein
MKIALVLLAAYVLTGIRGIMRDRRLPPMSRPFYAMRGAPKWSYLLPLFGWLPMTFLQISYGQWENVIYRWLHFAILSLAAILLFQFLG